MVLVKTSDSGVFDLSTGTLYTRFYEDLEVYFKGQLAMTVKDRYAEALWAYLNSKLEVSPESYMIEA